MWLYYSVIALSKKTYSEISPGINYENYKQRNISIHNWKFVEYCHNREQSSRKAAKNTPRTKGAEDKKDKNYYFLFIFDNIEY